MGMADQQREKLERYIEMDDPQVEPVFVGRYTLFDLVGK